MRRIDIHMQSVVLNETIASTPDFNRIRIFTFVAATVEDFNSRLGANITTESDHINIRADRAVQYGIFGKVVDGKFIGSGTAVKLKVFKLRDTGF